MSGVKVVNVVKVSQICDVNHEISFDGLYATLKAWISISYKRAMN